MTGDITGISVNYSAFYPEHLGGDWVNSTHPSRLGADWFNSTHHRNGSTMMDDKSITTLCDGPGQSQNTSLCDKKSLGITLSTPIIMMSTGVVGNIIAIIVLYTARKEMKRTVFYIFLFGMAWSDLFSQLLLGPIAIIVYANNLKWVGGEPVCKYHAFAMICFGIITPLFVCCMSLERVLALRFPYFHTRCVNVKKARILILLCWLCVLLFCCLPFVGFGSYEHQFPGSWCFLNFHKESTTDIAYAYMFALINLILIIVIIIANSIVVFTLLQMRKTRKINNSPSFDRRNGGKGKSSKLKMEEETHMVWFLCAITLAFAVCYLPLNINIIINQITGQVNYVADLLSLRMASINQILDPWLYVLLRKSVIIKGIKFLRYACTKNSSLKSKKRYVTNYSQSQVNSSVRNIDIHELKIRDAKVSHVINGDVHKHAGDISDTSSSSSMETEDEGEKRQLTPVHRASRLSDARSQTKRPAYNHSLSQCCGESFRSNQTSLTNRKTSLPARLFHST